MGREARASILVRHLSTAENGPGADLSSDIRARGSTRSACFGSDGLRPTRAQGSWSREWYILRRRSASAIQDGCMRGGWRVKRKRTKASEQKSQSTIVPSLRCSRYECSAAAPALWDFHWKILTNRRGATYRTGAALPSRSLCDEGRLGTHVAACPNKNSSNNNHKKKNHANHVVRTARLMRYCGTGPRSIRRSTGCAAGRATGWATSWRASYIHMYIRLTCVSVDVGGCASAGDQGGVERAVMRGGRGATVGRPRVSGDPCARCDVETRRPVHERDTCTPPDSSMSQGAVSAPAVARCAFEAGQEAAAVFVVVYGCTCSSCRPRLERER